MTMTDIAKSNTGLEDLATRIKTADRAVRDAAKNIVQQAVIAGQALNDAKAKLGHGEWLPWLERHCDLSERTAHNYMLLAANRVKFAIDADLTLNQAVGLLKPPPNPSDLYDKAEANLIKKLQDLSAEDAVDLVERAQRMIHDWLNAHTASEV